MKTVRTLVTLWHPTTPGMGIPKDQDCGSVESMIEWLGSRARYDFAISNGFIEEINQALPPAPEAT